MWGHGGIGSVIVDTLQKRFPTDPSWQKVRATHEKAAKREEVGVVTDEKELRMYVQQGYDLCNYEPGQLSIHNPGRYGGGLHMYVVGELADKYGELYDAHNFRAVQYRKAHGMAP